ncbi:MAG: eL32 family ribosomal protein [Candidatus Micrarchaeia archaeon]
MTVKHPKFLPQIYGRKKRISHRWRKPRGIDSKKRIEKKMMGAVPKIGWRGKKSRRGLHPLGMREILVSSPSHLDGMANVLVRISSSVGQRKREMIVKKAESMGLKVLNKSTVRHKEKETTAQ